MLLNLSQRSSRQLIHHHKPPRHFERRQARAACSLDHHGIETFIDYDIGYGNFAARAVGLAGYGGFGDSRLLFQKLLDLARINVEAARDNYVALAALQRVVS